MSFQAALPLFLLLVFSLSAAADSSSWQQGKAASEEESLFLRRIADFWQEGEYGIAKNQIEQFLVSFPESAFADPLSAAIGDLLLREKNYTDALKYYSQIISSEFLEKTFLHRMQCFYYLQWYATLIDECTLQLEKNLDADRFLKTTYYLAIALYHQCLNAPKGSELSLQLAQRAAPHFEKLLESDVNDETAQAFAHLCCILKDFSKAAEIYLQLAKNNSELEDEMSFQAALIQAEFDPPRAIQSFKEISEKKDKRAKEAAYNHMVLLFETHDYEELLKNKENFLDNIPSEKKESAYLFLGKSCLALKKYEQAAIELKNFIKESPEAACESLQSAFLSLMEASFEANDLSGMDLALAKLSELNPLHPEIAKGRFSRALLFKKLGDREQAQSELAKLLADCPQFSLRPQTLFELAHLEYQSQHWTDCRTHAQLFVKTFPESELAPFAWRYLASASAALATENPEHREFKECLLTDLEALLKHEERFSSLERSDWQFFLSKVYFDLGDLKKTINSLSDLLKESPHFPQRPNASLLLAICYRDEAGDLSAFCSLAKAAIQEGADLIDPITLHTSLFNAYLTRAEQDPLCFEEAAEHLYQVFENQGTILKDNIAWLAQYYHDRCDKEEINVLWAERASLLYKHLLSHCPSNEELEKEALCYKLATMYSMMGKINEQMEILRPLPQQYAASTAIPWQYEMEVRLLLAEGYAALGNQTEASSLYDLISNSAPPLRSRVSAQAHLQGARLRAHRLLEQKFPLDHPEAIQTLTALKDLILQKTLFNEPIHWEAAFEYVELKQKIQPESPEKRISLLNKIKSDFESQEDILSKDYHKTRIKFPEKDKIYLGYIQLLDAEILLAEAENCSNLSLQKELQAKGKDLLLEIIKEKAHSALVSRATLRLQTADGDLTKH
jgi:tetratricopeptide (TPR) repeat protein